jgi:hypothetical protein
VIRWVSAVASKVIGFAVVRRTVVVSRTGSGVAWPSLVTPGTPPGAFPAGGDAVLEGEAVLGGELVIGAAAVPGAEPAAA